MHRLQENPNLGSIFYWIEVGLVVLIILTAWLMRPKGPESGFKVRESDLLKNKKPSAQDPHLLAHAKMKKPEVLQLGGIRIDGKPHEILGVPYNATLEQVQQAYRELMKRYHPDKIGPAGSPQWKDAQKIAEAINLAKAEMVRNRK